MSKVVFVLGDADNWDFYCQFFKGFNCLIHLPFASVNKDEVRKWPLVVSETALKYLG